MIKIALKPTQNNLNKDPSNTKTILEKKPKIVPRGPKWIEK